jgi:hypothetical protein
MIRDNRVEARLTLVRLFGGDHRVNRKCTQRVGHRERSFRRVFGAGASPIKG